MAGPDASQQAHGPLHEPPQATGFEAVVALLVGSEHELVDAVLDVIGQLPHLLRPAPVLRIRSSTADIVLRKACMLSSSAFSNTTSSFALATSLYWLDSREPSFTSREPMAPSDALTKDSIAVLRQGDEESKNKRR